MRTKYDFPKLRNKTILSPMAGVTDVAFRTLAKKYGASLTYTEFLSSQAIVRNNEKTFRMMATDPIEKPVAIQIFGNSENDIINAAKIVQNKFDIIDVNCGCPAWKVIKTGAGSALLNNVEKISKFINKLATNVNKPITLKIRTGINEEKINAVEVAKAAEDSGASAIAIHGRTQEQGYSGKANWEIIKEVKNKINIPVIGNGDVFTPEDFKEKLDYSNVDYIMIARGAIGNPFIFKQINDFIKNGEYEKKNPIEQLFEYLDLAKKYNLSFSIIKSQAIGFTKGIFNGSRIREDLSKCNNLEELYNYLEKFNLVILE